MSNPPSRTRHPERKNWEFCVLQVRHLIDSHGCSLPWFRLLVATPWWQSIVTVTWYHFRQVSTNVIGLQSQAQSPLSVTAWALAANTKVCYSIIIHWPGRLPVYSYDRTSLCQISRKLLNRRSPITVLWVILTTYTKLPFNWRTHENNILARRDIPERLL